MYFNKFVSVVFISTYYLYNTTCYVGNEIKQRKSEFKTLEEKILHDIKAVPY